jgi:hypothetical protein
MEYESPPFRFGHAHNMMAQAVMKQLHALLLHADKRLHRRTWLKPMSTFLKLFIHNGPNIKVQKYIPQPVPLQMMTCLAALQMEAVHSSESLVSTTTHARCL